MLGVKDLTTTTHHCQRNRHVNWFNCKIFTQLPHCLAVEKKAGHICAATDVRVQRAGPQVLKHDPLSLVISLHPAWNHNGVATQRDSPRHLCQHRPKCLSLNLQHIIAALQARDNLQIKKAWVIQTAGTSQILHPTGDCTINQWVIVNKPLFTAKASNAHRMTTVSYNMLQPRNARPFQSIEVQPHTVVVDKDEVPITVLQHNSPRTEGTFSRDGAEENVYLQPKTLTTEQKQYKAVSRCEYSPEKTVRIRSRPFCKHQKLWLEQTLHPKVACLWTC